VHGGHVWAKKYIAFVKDSFYNIDKGPANYLLSRR
jgi:hypothetical protein